MSQRSRNPERARKGRQEWIYKKREEEDQIAAQLEADRLASDGPELSYAEQIKAWNEQVKAGKSKGRERQD